MNKEIIKDLLVGLFIAIIGIFLTFWLNTEYSKPVIEIDDNGGLYANMNNVPVGQIFIGNSGYSTDKNISIKIDDQISEKDINIPGFINDYNVKNVQDGTVITIKELRPTEIAHVFFTPKDKTVKYFMILETISESNNIYDLYYVDWWNISFQIKVLFTFLLSLLTFLGWYIPKRISYYHRIRYSADK